MKSKGGKGNVRYGKGGGARTQSTATRRQGVTGVGVRKQYVEEGEDEETEEEEEAKASTDEDDNPKGGGESGRKAVRQRWGNSQGKARTPGTRTQTKGDKCNGAMKQDLEEEEEEHAENEEGSAKEQVESSDEDNNARRRVGNRKQGVKEIVGYGSGKGKECWNTLTLQALL